MRGVNPRPEHDQIWNETNQQVYIFIAYVQDVIKNTWMLIRVFQTWNFVRKKLQYQYNPLQGIYKPYPKYPKYPKYLHSLCARCYSKHLEAYHLILQRYGTKVCIKKIRREKTP